MYQHRSVSVFVFMLFHA